MRNAIIRILQALVIVAVASSLAHAEGEFVHFKKKAAAGGGSCDTCTGTLLFSSHFENNDDITQGTPCGCNTNADITWALTNATYSSVQKSDGTYSLLKDSNTDSAEITVDSPGSTHDGSMSFDVYVSTWANNEPLLSLYVNDNNYINVMTSTPDKVILYYKGTNVAVSTAGVVLSTGAWHNIVASWLFSTNTNSLKLTLDGGAPDYKTAWIEPLVGSPILKTGYGTNAQYYLDNVVLKSVYQ